MANNGTNGLDGARSPAKWAALVDDRVVWAPQRTVPAAVLRTQGGVAGGRVLVRDHNSPDDVVLGDGDAVDLAAGNVFYTLGQDEVQPRGTCELPAKLAFFVDDRPEVTTRGAQTGQSLRDLFGLATNVRLVRDLESPADDDVPVGESADFGNGPVFYTRKSEHGLSITVNARVFTARDGVRKHMTGRDVAALVYPSNPDDTRVFLVSAGNREVGLGERLTIEGGEVFDVARKNVTGGFEMSRVDRELAALSDAGQQVTLVPSPSAVVYHGLRTRPGHQVPATDVLVLVPSGYPGQMLDGAYLPEGSPLIGRVKGAAQDPRVEALGRRWQLISYHPHNGGGGSPWNPGVHGLHTYIGEILSWLYDAN